MPGIHAPLLIAAEAAKGQDISKIIDSLNPVKILQGFLNDRNEYALKNKNLDMSIEQQRKQYEYDLRCLDAQKEVVLKQIAQRTEMLRESNKPFFKTLEGYQSQVAENQKQCADFLQKIVASDCDPVSKEFLFKVVMKLQDTITEVSKIILSAYEKKEDTLNEQFAAIGNTATLDRLSYKSNA